jgi:hypothetical protein
LPLGFFAISRLQPISSDQGKLLCFCLPKEVALLELRQKGSEMGQEANHPGFLFIKAKWGTCCGHMCSREPAQLKGLGRGSVRPSHPAFGQQGEIRHIDNTISTTERRNIGN